MSMPDRRRTPGVSARGRAYGRSIENGPPDNETFDRRRVDPPAGCRVAAEPAILTGRWSDIETN
jgi:hypothetical protein